jgi:hypothetical protein
MAEPPTGRRDPLADFVDFPLIDAMYGRRARRFGLGMQIPSGPLAFTSRAAPEPLSELEQAALIAAATGVTGWHFGVPHGPDRPDRHGHYAQRFTGRTAPTAGGFGTPMLLFTDDDGTYVTNTRDVQPSAITEFHDGVDDAERIMAVCRKHTTQLSHARLDLPAAPPHMLDPNLWMANRPGSTLFMPVGDASEQFLAFMAMAMANGTVIVDDAAGRPAGDLAPFIRSGLLDDAKRTPLSVLQMMAYEANCAELAFMGHNIVLVMQAMGLGGLFFTGLNRWCVRPGDAWPVEGHRRRQAQRGTVRRRVRRVSGRGRAVHLRHARPLPRDVHHDRAAGVRADGPPRHRLLRHPPSARGVPVDARRALGTLASVRRGRRLTPDGRAAPQRGAEPTAWGPSLEIVGRRAVASDANRTRLTSNRTRTTSSDVALVCDSGRRTRSRTPDGSRRSEPNDARIRTRGRSRAGGGR